MWWIREVTCPKCRRAGCQPAAQDDRAAPECPPGLAANSVLEIGDWQRFTGSTIGSYVGLVPSEYSSGTTRSQGSIAKAGNGHARGCWSRRPGITARSTAIPGRLCAPGGRKRHRAARARGHTGNHRLYHRWEQFTDRKKRPVIANVTIARGLAGWRCSLAVVDEQP